MTASPDSDEEELKALQARYGETYDGGMPEAFAQLFTPDGTLVLLDGTEVHGGQGLEAFAAAAAARPGRTHHFVQNQTFRVDGDVAHGAAHVTAVLRDGDQLRLLIMGRYEDTMSRTPGGWRFLTRSIHPLAPVDPG